MRTTKSLRLRLLAALTGVSACGALLLVAAGSASATPTYAAAHASHAAKEHLSKITESRSQVRKPAKITFGDGSCETNTVFGLVLKGDYRAVGNALNRPGESGDSAYWLTGLGEAVDLTVVGGLEFCGRDVAAGFV
jgi:hypothetical protein